MSKNYFSGIKACILPLKLGPYAIDALKEQIETNGGELCDSQKNATVVLTALTSPARIKRHITNYQVPVVSVQWIEDCEKNHDRVAMESYIVHTGVHEPESVLGNSTNDEVVVAATMPPELLSRRFATMPPDPLMVDNVGDHAADIPSAEDDSGSGLAPGFINSKYECLRPTPLKPYYNQRLVALLRLLERKRELDLEDKNALSYCRAIAAIKVMELLHNHTWYSPAKSYMGIREKAYPREISSDKEARKINGKSNDNYQAVMMAMSADTRYSLPFLEGIGAKIATLIQVYIDTGTIPEAEKLLGDERFRTVSLFAKVFGVGPKTANIWYDQGYRTLQQVLDDPGAKLVKAVRMGIQLLPDFDQPEDVQEIVAIIEKELPLVDENAFATPVGGYRRGKERNGDLDIVIASRELKHGTDQLLRRIVEHLTARGYIRHVLLMSDKNTNHFGNHYTSEGYVRILNSKQCFVAFMQPTKKIMRQVDFIVASLEDYPTAILGWTGSRQFERALRDYAKKEKGLSVKSHGIYTASTRERIKVDSEKHAFELIGIPWLEPEMRNC
ncbi:hypothetical protein BX666DRAFT_2030532 [Dichotomocladium elegans]|nr:hypothetical protein BX666DRAFT_2030532 [Dichotomocladium elegans]